MLTPQIRKAINEAFSLLPAKMDSKEARVEVYAIGFQEGDDFNARRQYNNGPAASFWQFEKGGGIKGVLSHPASKNFALQICSERGIAPTTQNVWNAMLYDDVLGAAFARLLLWTDPRALPKVPELINPQAPEHSESWQYYERNWRPGKPHPEKWAVNYAKALNECSHL